jgi:predicted Zn-dependent protease
MLQQLLKGAQVSADRGRRTRINGLDALVTNAMVQSGQESVALTLAAYAAGDQAYHFMMVSPPQAAGPASLNQLFASFRLISEAEARSLRPRRIDARRASGGDTIATLAAQMAGDNKVEHFMMLNGRSAGQPVRPGELVKLVVFGSPDR